MEKETYGSDKRHGFWFSFRTMFPVALVFLFLFGGAIFLSSLNNKVIAMGKAGFIRDAAWRIALSILAAAIAVFCVRGIIKERKSIKGFLGRLLGTAVCLLAACLLIRPVILDIAYLDHPPITYLSRLEFDDDHTGDGPARYYLRGTGIDGRTHSFSVNKEEYREGRELWLVNFELRAKAEYLPHTDIVLSLEYLTRLDEQAGELFPPADGLPDDWESFSIQINGKTYSLPAPLSAFLEDGWIIAEEDAGLRLSGADEPYEQYESQRIRLTNAQEQSLNMTVYNTTEQSIDIAQSTVGTVYVIYGNYDFAGTNLRLPGGLMLGWATREDVLRQYGRPAESYEEYSLTYRNDELAPAYWNLDFDESGYLSEVMVHNQAYSRDH